MRFFLFLFLFFSLSFSVFGQALSVHNLPSTSPLDLSENLLILPDSAASIDEERIISGRTDLAFTKNHTLSVGVIRQAQIYWGKILLQNKNNESERFLLKTSAYFPKITLFLKDNNLIVDTLFTGNKVKRKHRSAAYAGHIPGTLDLKLPAKTTYTLYFKFEFDWWHYQPKKITLNLYKQAPQNKIYSGRKLLFGLVLGIVLVMSIYNAALYMATKELGYLYYVLYIVLAGLFSLNYTNYTFQYFWPNIPEWHRLSFVHLGVGTILGFILFSKKFLHLPEKMPVLNRFIKRTLVFLLIPIILLWSGKIAYADIAMAASAVFAFTFVIYASVASIVKHNTRSAYFLIVGFFCLMVCFMLFLLFFFGPLKGDFEVYSYLPQIGIVLQIVIFGIGLSDKVYQLQKQNNKLLEKNKEELEAEVARRTEEINTQNEQIATQADDIRQKNESLNLTLDRLSKAQDNMQSSLNYAKRIQDAFLPQEGEIKNAVSDAFVFSKPRNIVSGDFYWFHELEHQNAFIIAAADCTGHGVPGAFMSMIGESLLHRIIIEHHITQPSKILDRLNREIIDALRQDENNIKDGMDINLCLVNRDTKEMQFAGARNQLTIIENGEIKNLRGDRKSIGGPTKEGFSFTNHQVSFSDDFQCYLSSDGYRDQIGGPNMRKIYQKNFDKLLFDIHKQSMEEQHAGLLDFFEKWMGGKNPQLDDILVIGFRV